MAVDGGGNTNNGLRRDRGRKTPCGGQLRGSVTRLVNQDITRAHAHASHTRNALQQAEPKLGTRVLSAPPRGDLAGAALPSAGARATEPGASCGPGMDELPEDQAAVYDRQLRVWGVEVQRK